MSKFETWDQAILYLGQNSLGLKISRNKFIRIWSKDTEAIDFVGSTDATDTYLEAFNRAMKTLQNHIAKNIKGTTAEEEGKVFN